MQNNIQIETVEIPSDYERIASNMLKKLEKLPDLPNLDDLHAQLGKLAVPSNPIITYQSINDDLEKVGAYYNRATEIYLMVFRHSQTLEAITGILTEGWMKFSNEKSEANRKGEARLKTAQLAAHATDVLIVAKSAERVMKNLENRHRTLSEELECQTRMNRMSDYSRTSMDLNRRQEPDLPSENEMFDVAPKQ